MLGKYLCSKEQINYLIRHFEVKKNGIKRKNTITVTSIFIRSPKKKRFKEGLNQLPVYNYLFNTMGLISVD